MTEPTPWWRGDPALSAYDDLPPTEPTPVEAAPAELQPLEVMRSFLGKRVLVTLDYDDPKATVVGVLHRLTDDGEVHVREDGGAMAYCWPCLRVEPWPND